MFLCATMSPQDSWGTTTIVEEVVQELKRHHKSPEDVLWVGLTDDRWTSWKEFTRLGTVKPYKWERDGDFSNLVRETNCKLVVVGQGWWLERELHQSDFSDPSWGWEYREMPRQPLQYGRIRKSDLVMEVRTD